MPSEKNPQLPPEILEACLFLKLDPSELTIESVESKCGNICRKLRKNFASTKPAIAAKDTLLSWLEDGGGGPYRLSGVPKQPLPGAGGADVGLPLPEPDPENEP